MRAAVERDGSDSMAASEGSASAGGTGLIDRGGRGSAAAGGGVGVAVARAVCAADAGAGAGDARVAGATESGDDGPCFRRRW